MVKSRQLQVTQQQKETTTISDATITSQRQYHIKKADTRKKTQNRDATITSQRQYYTITNRKNPNFALRPDEFNRIGSKSALELFYQGIRSQETKKTYTRRLKNVLCDILQNILHGTFEQRTEELVKKSRKDPQWTRDLLLCVSSKIKQRTKLPRHHIQYLKPSSVSNFFKPVKKLLEMNAIKIDWERIRVTFPEVDNTDNSRGWQKQEIQKMLNNTENPIDTALILVASSSGIRKGGFTLNWDDIMPVYYTNGKLTLDSTKASEIACAIIRIYSGTSSVYMGFITPEAFASIIHYKKTQWIPKMKREPQPQDPVFLSESSLRLGINGIYKRIKHTAQNSDLVQFLEKGDRRFEVPILCGFRRFWNKTFSEILSDDSTLASLIKKEYMMGHTGLIKLDRSYFKVHVMELATQYLEVISSLSISEKFKKSAEGLLAKKKKHDGVKAIEHKISEFNHCVSIIKKDLKQKELEIVQLSESLRNQGIIK